MTTATETETALLVHEARRTLAVRLAGLVLVTAIGTAIAIVASASLERSSRWKHDLQRTGAKVTATVADVHPGLAGGENDRVTLRLPEGMWAPSLTVEVDDLGHYPVGRPIDVYYDLGEHAHVRTVWDVRTDRTELPAQAALAIDAIALLAALAHLPRTAIGMRVARGHWKVALVRVRILEGDTRRYHRRPPLLLVQQRGDPAPFGATYRGWANLRPGGYQIRVAERGPWRVVAATGGTAIVRRPRFERTARRWRRTISTNALPE